MFKKVSSQIDFPSLEQEQIDYWKENKTFEKSVQLRPEDKKWTFLDGPPFVTGTPHYGSLLSSIPKDVFGRYWTMKGFRVRRVWGWDGHGLPIENKVENELGIKSKKEIEEKIGIAEFVKRCLTYVDDVSADWEWYVEHIGRWVDFKNAYKTWDLPYMETVMWVFKQIHDKGYIYKGFKVILFCPHCSTPISNFEVAMDTDNYKDVTEPTAVYKYELKDEPTTFILAWSTTPWNKIVTPALAVNPELTYIKIKQGEESYILAESTKGMIKDQPFKILESFRGEKLVGKKFIPHYNYYKIEGGKRAFEIIGDEFVTADEGTGVVTIAAYGEEDLAVMNRDNVQIVLHLDDEGKILNDVPKFGGLFYLDANKEVLDDLENRHLIYRLDQYTHSVPHCWRCGTRLYYAPKDAWYINIALLKPKLFKNNEPINWFPKHFKEGRFTKSMEAAPDWNISRNRYWGSPVPVWECECGERFVPGSIKELEERSGRKVNNLHRPEIDDVTFKCQKCSKLMERVPEVLDSWVEAGSASFGERHFPFDKEENLKDFFPPDFIAEYTGQIRAWFYVLHVIGTALYDSPAFKNVLVEGVMLGTDGRKMSKNYGNYPDPKELMQKHGGDALRFYLLGSPIMKGEDVNFSNDGVPEVVRGFMLILWNCYKYFVDYANTYSFSRTEIRKVSLEILDRWILAKLSVLIEKLHVYYESYDTTSVVSLLKEFVVSDLSTWYIRRSRVRINGDNAKDREACLGVLYHVLTIYSRLLAPVAPFISEEIYRNLTGEDSVHLTDYPTGKDFSDKALINNMELVREIVEKGHARRKEEHVKLRQPLASAKYLAPERLSEDLEKIIADELNVKNVEYERSLGSDVKVELDTKITSSLQQEGETRELIRQIQQLRKDEGLTLQDRIEVSAPGWPEGFEEMIKKSTAAIKISKSDSLKIQKVK